MSKTIETSNTLVQKSTIVSIEWDKQNSVVLYFGNNLSTIKKYNINEQKITQELMINRLFPNVNQICSFSSNGNKFKIKINILCLFLFYNRKAARCVISSKLHSQKRMYYCMQQK